jgi:serine O-acetyltransferase
MYTDAQVGIKEPVAPAAVNPMQSGQPSADTPDWSREYRRPFSWNPGLSMLASIRSYQRHSGRQNLYSMVVRKVATLRHRFWSAVCGADIDINCRIGGGLLIPHPNGIVIFKHARIGPNCLLLQQTTIGTNGSQAAPILEGHVDVGAGAKLLGGIRVGAHAKIGANAVVLNDVPPFATAVGVPARNIAGQPYPSSD